MVSSHWQLPVFVYCRHARRKSPLVLPRASLGLGLWPPAPPRGVSGLSIGTWCWRTFPCRCLHQSPPRSLGVSGKPGTGSCSLLSHHHHHHRCCSSSANVNAGIWSSTYLRNPLGPPASRQFCQPGWRSCRGRCWQMGRHEQTQGFPEDTKE